MAEPGIINWYHCKKNCTFFSSWTPNNSKLTFLHKFHLYSDRSSLICTNCYTKISCCCWWNVHALKYIRLVPATHLFIPSPYHISLPYYCFYTYDDCLNRNICTQPAYTLQRTYTLEYVSKSLYSLKWSLHSHWTPSYKRRCILTQIHVVIKAHILIQQNEKKKTYLLR